MLKNNILIQYFPELAKLPALRNELAELCVLQTAPSGTVFLEEGAYIKMIPLLVSGLVKVYKEDENGHEILLYYIQSGESCIMSLTACVNNNTSKVKAVIVETSEVLLLPSDNVVSLGKRYPQWNEFVYNLYNAKFEELLEFVKLLTFSKKDQLLLDYLKKEAAIKSTRELKITHQKIANELGSSREVISRLLKKLENEKVLKLGSGVITLL